MKMNNLAHLDKYWLLHSNTVRFPLVIICIFLFFPLLPFKDFSISPNALVAIFIILFVFQSITAQLTGNKKQFKNWKYFFYISFLQFL